MFNLILIYIQFINTYTPCCGDGRTRRSCGVSTWLRRIWGGRLRVEVPVAPNDVRVVEDFGPEFLREFNKYAFSSFFRKLSVFFLFFQNVFQRGTKTMWSLHFQNHFYTSYQNCSFLTSSGTSHAYWGQNSSGQ